MITPEQVADKLATLKQQREKLAINVHQHDGAIAVLEELLKADTTRDHEKGSHD